MKILALDVGEKRIGYAVSDESRTLAFPRGVFVVKEMRKFLEDMAKFVIDEKISEIVIGVALGEENEETESSRRARALGKKIHATTGLPVHFVDEFGSTGEAVSKIPLRKDRRQKGADDAIAAQVILERYLVAGAGFGHASRRP